MHVEVQEGSELLAELIKDEPDYRSFLDLSAELEQIPELSAQVQAFRRRNYELQSSAEDPEQTMWDMTSEYRELTRNSLVSAYFEAEAGVCRMLQDVMNCIYSEIRFPEL